LSSRQRRAFWRSLTNQINHQVRPRAIIDAPAVLPQDIRIGSASFLPAALSSSESTPKDESITGIAPRERPPASAPTRRAISASNRSRPIRLGASCRTAGSGKHSLLSQRELALVALGVMDAPAARWSHAREGISPTWQSRTHRWETTSTLTRAGRWFAAEHPAIERPGHPSYARCTSRPSIGCGARASAPSTPRSRSRLAAPAKERNGNNGNNRRGGVRSRYHSLAHHGRP
jgi:hypothetical protein